MRCRNVFVHNVLNNWTKPTKLCSDYYIIIYYRLSWIPNDYNSSLRSDRLNGCSIEQLNDDDNNNTMIITLIKYHMSVLYFRIRSFGFVCVLVLTNGWLLIHLPNKQEYSFSFTILFTFCVHIADTLRNWILPTGQCVSAIPFYVHITPYAEKEKKRDREREKKCRKHPIMFNIYCPTHYDKQ